MKKALVTISIILSISLALPFFACADNTTPTDEAVGSPSNQLSSSYIDPSVLEKLDLGPLDKIVKCYSIQWPDAFAEYSTIEEMLNSDYYNYTFYAVLSGKEGIKLYKEDGSLIQHDTTFNKFVLPEYFAESIIKLISPDINVYNVYYIARLNPDTSTLLYYETDMGDYVYQRNQGKHLYPGAVFVDYMRYEVRKDTALSSGVHFFEEELGYDRSIYDISSDNFNPRYLPAHLDPNAAPEKANDPWTTTAAIAAGTLIVAAACVFLWRKRNRNWDY